MALIKKQKNPLDEIRYAVKKGINARLKFGVKLVPYDELTEEEKNIIKKNFPAKRYNEIKYIDKIDEYDIIYYCRVINNKIEKVTSVIAFKHSDQFPYVSIPFKKYINKGKYDYDIDKIKHHIHMKTSAIANEWDDEIDELLLDVISKRGRK